MCLQVSEASVSRNRSTIIVPAGSTRDEGWSAFRNILEEINQASKLFGLSDQVPFSTILRVPFLFAHLHSSFSSRLSVSSCSHKQQNSEAITQERLVGLSDDVGAGFIAGNSSQSAPTPSSELNLGDRTPTFDLPPPSSDESSGFGVSKVIRADQKRFFFDLGSNNRGHYLRISEVRLFFRLLLVYFNASKDSNI